LRPSFNTARRHATLKLGGECGKHHFRLRRVNQGLGERQRIVHGKFSRGRRVRRRFSLKASAAGKHAGKIAWHGCSDGPNNVSKLRVLAEEREHAIAFSSPLQ
jgi:hypothetical protein